MPKIVKELTDVAVRNLKRPGFHAVGGVAGLILQVTESGARSWVLRYSIDGKVRHAGLGSYSVVSLAQARETAREMRFAILNGRDPIEERREAKRKLEAERANRITFKEAAYQCHETKARKLRSQGHIRDWIGSLERYAFAYIGDTPVNEITRSDVLRVLDPIWTTKTGGTAQNVRQRMHAVLEWAEGRGFRQGENPADWKKLKAALGDMPSHRTRPRQALPWQEAPQFMQELRKRNDPASWALDFLILTAVRPTEARLAEWSEIDLDAKVWTIPAERMKAGKEHRVPLCQDLVTLLSNIDRVNDRYVFALDRNKSVRGDHLLLAARAIVPGLDAHGFRSTFRDWAGEATGFPRDVIEAALAHSYKGATEASYHRGDLFQKRRKLMEAWSRYLRKPTRTADVVDIGAAQRA